MTPAPASDLQQTLAALGPIFAERASRYDDSDSFVAENYSDMRTAKLFSVLVPKELGGGDHSYSDVCSLIRGIAARSMCYQQRSNLTGSA